MGKTAASDDELMIVQKKRLQQKHASKMMRFMKEADESNDGLLQRDELKKICAIPDVKVWFAAQELDVDDVDLLFDLLDGGEGHISVTDLIHGVAKLKGSAKAIDMVGLMHMTSSLSSHLCELEWLLKNRLRPTMAYFHP